jgi:dihydrofolate reductase
MISLVVAYAKDRVIGRDNDLPWRLPPDLKHFKKLTTGKTVVMGRNTYESIVGRLGKPLPNRRNIVISNTLKSVPDGVEVVSSLDEALRLAKNDGQIVIIGGQQVFDEALNRNLVERIYATEIDLDVKGDKFFPKLDMADWRQIAKEDHIYEYTRFSFVTLERN